MKIQRIVTNKLIYAVATILVLAIFVIYLTPKMEIANGALEYLPALNASINATVSVLLILGYYFIRIKKDRKWHSISMKSAFILTALFLISYVIYHTTHESTSYGGSSCLPCHFTNPHCSRSRHRTLGTGHLLSGVDREIRQTQKNRQDYISSMAVCLNHRRRSLLDDFTLLCLGSIIL